MGSASDYCLGITDRIRRSQGIARSERANELEGPWLQISLQRNKLSVLEIAKVQVNNIQAIEEGLTLSGTSDGVFQFILTILRIGVKGFSEQFC